MANNPFYFGKIVEGGAFCNRSKELLDLERACRNTTNIFLYSERRMGKTSLVKKVLANLPREEYVPVYIDLWATYAGDTFSRAMAKAVAEAGSNNADKAIELSKSLFSRLAPSIGLDDQGKPTVTFGLSNRNIDMPTLEQVLDSPALLADKLHKKCVVVFDEFQQILEYDDDLVERTLRSKIQHHKNVSYIFMGSRKHLIQKLFIDGSRPLYRSAAHFPLHAIETDDWIPFIGSRFNNANKFITKDLIRTICAKTDGHPFYTQLMCHTIWNFVDANEHVTAEIIGDALQSILDSESYSFVTLFDSLAVNEKRLLEALARNGAQEQLYSSEFVATAGFKSSSSLQRAVASLINKDLVDRNEDGSYSIVDKFLKLWIRRRLQS